MGSTGWSTGVHLHLGFSTELYKNLYQSQKLYSVQTSWAIKHFLLKLLTIEKNIMYNDSTS